MKNNGVPILSKAEIDAIGERFVQDFQPEVLTKRLDGDAAFRNGRAAA